PGLYTLGRKLADLYEGYVAASLQPERLPPGPTGNPHPGSRRAHSRVWSGGDLEVVQVRGRRGARDLQEVSKGFRGASHALALGKVYLASLREEEWPTSLGAPVLKRYT